MRRSQCALPAGLALVGSAADCPIRLVDPSVSSYHGSLVHTPRGVWVVDLLGEGGIRVNGQGVSFAPLHPGDALQVGHSVIRFAAEAPPCPPLATFPEPPTADRALGIAVPAAAPFDAFSEAPPARGGELAERVLDPLVRQVVSMQQQMTEEIHQARAFMYETLNSLRQEQSDLLARELDDVRELGRELHALRAELEDRLAALSASAAAAAPAAARLGSVTTQTPPEVVLVPEILAPEDYPAGSRASAAPNGAARTLDDLAHARLCAKITQIKQKQQSRWEKVVSMFPSPLRGKTTF